MRHPLLRHIGPALAGLVLVLAGNTALAEPHELSVTVGTTAPHPVPPGALLVVELLDISLADAPSVTLSARRYRIPSLPVVLELPYDSAAIDPRMRYVVSARVEAADTVLLRTTTAYPVLTGGATETVAITLDWTGPEPAAQPGIAGVSWAAQEIGGRALATDDPPTIAFLEDGHFNLFAGCNLFRGKAALSEGRIAFPGAMAGTRQICEEPQMRLERDMIAALQRSTGYRRDGARLSLTTAERVVVLRLAERPE